MLQALQHGRERELYDLWAYVVMPEHVHLVLYPRPHTLIHNILKAIKQSVSRSALVWLEDNDPRFLSRLAHVNAAGVTSYRFWQRGGGYDRNLRSIADVFEKIEYCHNNPIRRGLADRAGCWRWSSALAWETGRNEPIAIDRESVPRLG
jgi:putative transposase